MAAFVDHFHLPGETKQRRARDRTIKAGWIWMESNWWNRNIMDVSAELERQYCGVVEETQLIRMRCIHWGRQRQTNESSYLHLQKEAASCCGGKKKSNGMGN